jgi:DNA-binding transcriptional regulator LsrR (DeoR family)
VETSRAQRHERKLDQAARAAWLYYVAGNTQDQIAEKLNVSRQAAQRLVALAVDEKLIRFRLDHPLAEAMALSEALSRRYGLAYCAVEPTDPPAENPRASIAAGAAEYLSTFLVQKTPVVASSVEERQLLQTQHSYAVIRDLAAEAAAAFLGISQVGWQSPLHQDLFITDPELADLIDRGAVGEIAGWAFDRDGRLLDGGTNDRVAGLPLARLDKARIIGVTGGPEKTQAIAAALRGRLVSGLITDEATAAAVLAVGQ